MHFGIKNPERDCYIGHGQEMVVLGKTEAEKDLGVKVNNIYVSQLSQLN